ncbi:MULTISPECIES: LytTR family DNA-binding domain-containing protein [unclassified Chitinophaga]|uniref:LytR/AlgR family response regulator transcription factor n=1 Tax=unclassified Chitinophaga TaxID=2619133 RepID=UPI0009CE6FF7|nr:MULTISPECIES: LytTR family DNA-binding domain-containing protein [unclassified Chitinophaga]OMP76680.1 DNA-binding response regulator [[Flexibacter] sp. ATCC 35208]WPV63851.1 LytTR family DNA-binding domain-containing protein [Chitinophaga sp. LS1]
MALRVAIIEDEPATARNLRHMLQDIAPEIEVLTILPGVAESVAWLNDNMQQCELLFMDVRLSDGLSFDIFSQVNVTLPVIFVTAYDDYALQAFKANGIDYILKPFDESELKQSLQKYNRLRDNSKMQQLVAQFKSYKQSFLVHNRDKLIPLSAGNIAWFYTANELVYAGTVDNKQYIIDFTMEQLQQQLDPAVFFRANRQFIVQRGAIQEVDFYFNGRLALKVHPAPKEQILISKARVPEFKNWMNV